MSCLSLLMSPTCGLPDHSAIMLPLQALQAWLRHTAMQGRHWGDQMNLFGRGGAPTSKKKKRIPFSWY